MATPRFFLRVGAWYESLTGKALSSDLEITDVVNNSNPTDPFVEDDGSGGGGTTPTLDAVLAEGSTLTEDRTIDINGHDLIFSDGARQLWYLSKIYSEMVASDDPDRRAQFDLVSDSSDPENIQQVFILSATGGPEEVELRGDGATGNFTFTGNTSTFTGSVSVGKILNLGLFNNVSPTDGDIWREENTNTGLKVRINGVTKTITVS